MLEWNGKGPHRLIGNAGPVFLLLRDLKYLLPVGAFARFDGHSASAAIRGPVEHRL